MARTYDPEALVAGALAGDRASVARLISMVEKGGESAHAAIARLYPHTGSAYTVGITGAPGAGKSTLTDKLITRVRKEDVEVGVLAIDPSSPFTGGAILGDRVRMQDHATDPGVFIRSMATRGHLGGLSLATPQAVRVLDAAGKPWVLIETVGVGQVEIEVAGAADTTMVVVNPGWGDAVQAAKAGLLEIADLFVVNKADRDGAAETVRDLEFMLDLSLAPPPGETAWRPPIIKTVASRGEGLEELWEAIGAHRAFLETDGRLAVRRTKRIRDELRAIIVERLYERAGAVCAGDRFDGLAASVEAREVDPYSAAESLLEETLS
ncbi:MAG TPA: methylmalonyl Co-A mutase-associated GTPase MeaB [Acidimicrobiia bacterium]|nr:methylmalonyl Co-A mutase-associated GTPase MeaB [Acidimicrobiia bacterium]